MWAPLCTDHDPHIRVYSAYSGLSWHVVYKILSLTIEALVICLPFFLSSSFSTFYSFTTRGRSTHLHFVPIPLIETASSNLIYIILHPMLFPKWLHKSLQVFSLNHKGFYTPEKRRQILYHFHKLCTQILLLQETHFRSNAVSHLHYPTWFHSTNPSAGTPLPFTPHSPQMFSTQTLIC